MSPTTEPPITTEAELEAEYQRAMNAIDALSRLYLDHDAKVIDYPTLADRLNALA